MGYDFSSGAAGSAYAASETAKKNADKLEDIRDTIEGIDKFCGQAGKYLMAIREQNTEMIKQMRELREENKELHSKISSLEAKINKTPEYVR